MAWKKNSFEVNGNEITIRRADWKTIVQTTYREDYYAELTSHIWDIDDNGYPTNKALGGSLHRYIMEKWYGKEMLDEMTSKGYIVDHINNNHCDCRIQNLEFLKKDYNTAKDQQLDKDIRRMLWNIALSIFKDFDTGCYQITIGCNDPMYIKDQDGKPLPVDSIKLLYGGDYNKYPIVLLDAENLLLNYELDRNITYTKTRAAMIRIYIAPVLQATEEEKQQAIVMRNGIPYLNMEKGDVFLVSIHPDHQWTIPNDHDGNQKVTIMTPIENISS